MKRKKKSAACQPPAVRAPRKATVRDMPDCPRCRQHEPVAFDKQKRGYICKCGTMVWARGFKGIPAESVQKVGGTLTHAMRKEMETVEVPRGDSDLEGSAT